MKRLIQWLARVFDANITKEVRVEVEKRIYLAPETIQGDVNVEGNLSVCGRISATGGITCYEKKGGKE